MRVATILGTRPEIIRLSRVMAALDHYVEHTIIHTGQNYDYELNQIFFEDLEIRKPDVFLNAPGATASQTVANVIARADEALGKVCPDAVLVLGDTNSCMAAYSAKRRKIPVFHMEAGNRCFDERVPEEINRRIVDRISDINMPYSDISREYLLREGFPPERVIKTGSPMFEVLHHYLPKIQRSDVLGRLHLKPTEYFVVSCHREENVDNSCQLELFLGLLNFLADEYEMPIVVSTHPRTKKRLTEHDAKLSPQVDLRAPLGFCDYVQLQKMAKATLSDSGTIFEESSILGFPALSIREVHERPEAMEEAAVIMTGFDQRRVREGLRILSEQATAELSIVGDYNVTNVSEKVVRIILSYVNYINQLVWHKTQHC